MGAIVLIFGLYYLYYEIKKLIKPEIFFIMSKEGIGIRTMAYGLHYMNWEDVSRVYIENGFVNVLIKTPEKMPQCSTLRRIISYIFEFHYLGDIGINLFIFRRSPQEVLDMLNKYMPKEMEITF